ncbi:hypothetical protein NM688_g275 [Phlebia brevispora]|uniref:Uncharacterized protein n=1 Tax=Phlebia brevispora TaxID=194682 RepID=A0ACC1TEH8_9APHY|nr:hypothetical protein NM688_g275 [Phlebia brevispora]
MQVNRAGLKNPGNAGRQVARIQNKAQPVPTSTLSRTTAADAASIAGSHERIWLVPYELYMELQGMGRDVAEEDKGVQVYRETDRANW